MLSVQYRLCLGNPHARYYGLYRPDSARWSVLERFFSLEPSPHTDPSLPRSSRPHKNTGLNVSDFGGSQAAKAPRAWNSSMRSLARAGVRGQARRTAQCGQRLSQDKTVFGTRSAAFNPDCLVRLRACICHTLDDDIVPWKRIESPQLCIRHKGNKAACYSSCKSTEAAKESE